MKKLILIALVGIIFIGCRKNDNITLVNTIPSELAINSVSGIKLETPFVTSQVSMNVKSEVAQTVTIKIFDISNRVVSKSTSDVKAGDNVLKVYTNALPSSAYRIALFDDKGNQLGITDFNKI
jgi:uncharacterized protein YcfL